MKYQFKANATYIIGVSGGGDSMALLDKAVNEGLNLVVAHVNYHKRVSANRDEQIVRDYCKKNNLIFVKDEPVKTTKENFQAWAREARFSFFKKLYVLYQAEGLLLAHQKDDVIETYLLQEKRTSKVSYYGIKTENYINGMLVIRPLLDYTKKELELYDQNHHVAFGVDESNLSDAYQRNKIRHEIIDTSSDLKKEEIIQEIAVKNQQLQAYQDSLRKIYAYCFIPWNKERYASFDEEIRCDILRKYLIMEGVVEAYDYSNKFLKKLDDFCLLEHNAKMTLGKNRVFAQSYGQIKIYIKQEGYSYQIDTALEMQTPYFRVSFTEGKTTQAVYLTEADFPLTIRSPLVKDEIEMRFGYKKLSRFFIDRKVPIWEREVWPVVVNKQGKVILVPNLGCDIEHYNSNPTMFVIK